MKAVDTQDGQQQRSTSRMQGPQLMRATTNYIQKAGLVTALIVLIAIFSIVNPTFLSPANISAILVSVAIVGIVAIPGAMLIISGYVDFSVGSNAVLAAIVFGVLAGTDTVPVFAAFFIALAAGAVWGTLAGWMICKLRMSAIIVTLGGYAGLRGLAEYISEGQTEFGFGSAFAKLGNASLLGLPAPVWILTLLILIGIYFWYLTPFGRYVTSIGADPVAAHALGIKTQTIPLFLYIASGTLAALGGLVLVSQLDASSLSIGLGLEIQVLTAILLGGVAFTGGRGTLVGVLLGVLFIGILTNGLVVINISPFITNVAVGIALVFAAAIDALNQRSDNSAPSEEQPAATSDSRPLADAHSRSN